MRRPILVATLGTLLTILASAAAGCVLDARVAARQAANVNLTTP